jgi:hypothetical protein
MKLAFCVACGSTDDLQHHHLVTRAEGGSDDEAKPDHPVPRLSFEAARAEALERIVAAWTGSAGPPPRMEARQARARTRPDGFPRATSDLQSGNRDSSRMTFREAVRTRTKNRRYGNPAGWQQLRGSTLPPVPPSRNSACSSLLAGPSRGLRTAGTGGPAP